MSQVIVTTTTPPVTVVASASTPAVTVRMASTSMGLAASDQHDMVLPLSLILRDTIRGTIGLTTVMQ